MTYDTEDLARDAMRDPDPRDEETHFEWVRERLELQNPNHTIIEKSEELTIKQNGN